MKKTEIEKECYREYIPDTLKLQVLDILRKNQTGIVRSKMLVRSYVWWPNIDSSIEKYIKCCSEF